jgi:hypothetical protein
MATPNGPTRPSAIAAHISFVGYDLNLWLIPGEHYMKLLRLSDFAGKYCPQGQNFRPAIVEHRLPMVQERLSRRLDEVDAQHQRKSTPSTLV